MRAIAALSTLPALLFAVPAIAAPATPTEARGVVTDASTGRPLGAVFVQQEGGLASAFSGAEGNFTLNLDRSAQMRLTITANGYEPKTIDVGSGRDLKVALKPLSLVATPSAPTAAETINNEVENLPTLPLDSHVGLAYRVRYESQTSNNATLAGFANNDYRIDLRYRWKRLLLEANGAHFQAPVDVTGLPRDLNPAYSPSTYEGNARLGYIVPLKGGWESAFGAAYRYKNTVPNNHDVPYVGNGVDFEQTRHAFGLSATASWLAPKSPWGVEGSLAAFPLVYGIAKDPGTPFANQFGIEGDANVTYEITRGLRFGVGYRYEGWNGNGGNDTVHLLSAQFFYVPVGIFKGSEK